MCCVCCLLDPSGVLNLLQSALNMERLSGLLKQDHLEDAEVLPQLQNRLEGEWGVAKGVALLGWDYAG